MRAQFVIMCVLAAGACAAPQPGDEAPEWNGATTVERTTQALQASQGPSDLQPSAADAGTLSGTQDLSGKNKCTPDRQAACDECAAACASCSKKNGGGPAGGCIGLFCPTRCDACVLGCYTTCGKCVPSSY